MAEDAIVDEGDSHCHPFRFYVDTKANPPTPSWVHPHGPPPSSPQPAPSQAAAPPTATSPPPVNLGEPENPDRRPLPAGWIGQYEPKYVLSSFKFLLLTEGSSSHKAFFYVNTTAPNPTPSWTHPLGPPSTHTGPQATSGPTSPVPFKATSPPPQPATPGQPENPDKRPLPTGWVQQYDPR